MGEVLWWAFVPGAKVKGGYCVGFKRRIGKQRWWSVSGIGGEGKMTPVGPLCRHHQIDQAFL